MTPENRKIFIETVLGFAEIKGKQLSAPALELYWRAMQRWPIEDFRAAAEQLLRTCEFMPTPKDFEDLRKAGRATNGEAWTTARQTVRNASWSDIEATGFTCGDDLIDRAAHAIGGYRAIGMCDSDKLCFLEKRFAEHYETLRDAQEVREAVPQVAYQNGSARLSGPASARQMLSAASPGEVPA